MQIHERSLPNSLAKSLCQVRHRTRSLFALIGCLVRKLSGLLCLIGSIQIEFFLFNTSPNLSCLCLELVLFVISECHAVFIVLTASNFLEFINLLFDFTFLLVGIRQSIFFLIKASSWKYPVNLSLQLFGILLFNKIRCGTRFDPSNMINQIFSANNFLF